MEWTYAWPLSGYYAAYCDPIKSLPHKGPSGVVENPQGLPFWTPLQRYLVSYEDYLDVISEMDLEEFIIEDPVLDQPLAKFYVENGKSAIWDGNVGNGMINFQYNLPALLSYRKRSDGLLGLESISGVFDTRLSNREYLAKPELYPKNVRRTTTDDANFSTLVDNIRKDLAKAKKSQK